MSRDRRLELIERIQEERKSMVVAFVLSDVPGCEGILSPDAVEELYHILCDFKPLERKPLDLFLFAHCGDTAVPWRMVGMIREMFDSFNVIVPHKAHGPGTMIALGADTIIMGERGSLSPLEVLTSGDSFWKGHPIEVQGLSIEDAKAVMSLLESFGRMREKQKIDAFLRIIENVHPLLLGNMQKRMEQIRLDCLGLLERRKRRFTKSRNKKIVSRLLLDSVSHQHDITRTEAKRTIGLKQVRIAKALDPLFGKLLSLYEQEFKTDAPLYPAALPEALDQDEMVFANRKRGFIESTKRSRVLVEDRKVQEIREIAPSIRLDPQIILPALEIPSELSEPDVWSFIEGWLQGNLPGLIEDSFVRFKRSLPVSEYKWSSFNRRWVDL